MANVTVSKDRYTVDPLYQWDLNQVLKIYGLSLASIPEIHFVNDAMDRAIVRQSTMDAAGVISVDVPNSLLQKPYKIKAYVCVYEGDAFRSLYLITIPVEARSQPYDYTLVDDEEVYSFNALENYVNNTLFTVLERYDDVDAKYREAVAALDETTEKATAAQTAAESAQKSAERAQEVANGLIALAETHADRHASDGEDPITPEDIGAATADHKHTAEDVGARPDTWTPTAVEVGAIPIIDANSASYDMDAIIANKSLNGYIYKTGNATLGTPYAKGITTLSSANIVNISSSVNYGAQFAFPSGGTDATPMFWRTLRGGVISDWTTGFLPLAGGTLTGNLTIKQAGEMTSAFRVENGHGAANFTISSSGNIGLYDPVNGKWLLMFTPTLNRLALPIQPDPDQYSVRQIKAGTTDLVDGETTLATGSIYVYYEE